MPHIGFNFQWLLHDQASDIEEPDERALDFLAENGFTFVRLPTNYRSWTNGTAYAAPDESVLVMIDRAIAACSERGLHACLNLHRAPGYCINQNELETHNLWLDAEAQDGFVHLWSMFAARYQGIRSAHLSFDLVNEPPAVGEHGLTRDNHASLIRRTVAAIRTIDSRRPLTVDGLDGGNLAMPELADLEVTHSGRGYQPYSVSHWGATWWDGWQEGDGPYYPGCRYAGTTWDREALRRFYAPWRAIEDAGGVVHIGEFGCYDQTPNDVALRWLSDLLDLYREFRWGYAMWNFVGPFGIIGHRRLGARCETMGSYRVDRDMLELMMQPLPS